MVPSLQYALAHGKVLRVLLSPIAVTLGGGKWGVLRLNSAHCPNIGVREIAPTVISLKRSASALANARCGRTFQANSDAQFSRTAGRWPLQEAAPQRGRARSRGKPRRLHSSEAAKKAAAGETTQ